jgi:integrase
VRGDGRTFKRGAVWWIAYFAPKDGRTVEAREPAMVPDRDGNMRRAQNDQEARRALRARRDQIAAHYVGKQQFIGRKGERIRFAELMDDLQKDYERANGGRGRASLDSMISHAKCIRAYFGEDVAVAITDERLWEFVEHQRGQEYSEASIKHQLGFIRRAFNLARKRLPYIPTMPEITVDNAREGYTSKAELQAILQHLEESIADWVEWFFWTGMRPSTINRLEWNMVDLETWTLHLPGWAVKSKKGFPLPLRGGPLDVMKRRLQARRLDSPLIFHRDGAPVGTFYKQWRTATKAAKVPGLLIYDLRRTAARNMTKAGVRPNIAMRIMGLRTDAMFHRYNILDDDDVAKAIETTTAYVDGLPAIGVEGAAEREPGQNPDNPAVSGGKRRAAVRAARGGSR